MNGGITRKEVLVIIGLYLFVFYIWSLPVQKSNMPFGSTDPSQAHFPLADYMAQTDKPIWKLPNYMDWRYHDDNKFLPGHAWYPPAYHTSLAIAQIIGGERVTPIFIFVALFSSLFVITNYFFMRHLFGFWPAFLSSLILGFSVRDFMTYLWGQWPMALSMFYIPLIIYFYYRYTDSYFEKKPEKKYLIIMALLLAGQFLIHPMGFFHSLAVLSVFSVLLIIKEKKLPVNTKHLIIPAIIFLLLLIIFAPLQILSIARGGGGHALTPQQFGIYHPESLLKWYQKSAEYEGFPEFYYSYEAVHGGKWTIPFLFIGIGFLLLRRNRKDLLLLSWLIALYVLLHLDIINIGIPARSLATTAQIFYPIIGVGAVAIPSILKLNERLRIYLTIGIAILFIILAINFNVKTGYAQLNSAYAGPLDRINSAQYQAAEWLRANLPVDSKVFAIGTFGKDKMRWMGAISFKQFTSIKPDLYQNISTHLMFDYSDINLLQGYQEYVEQKKIMQQEETKLNYTKIYDNNDIRVYEIG